MRAWATTLFLWTSSPTPWVCKRSITFLVDGEIETAKLTYAELDRRVRAIAVQLIDIGASGKRALPRHWADAAG